MISISPRLAAAACSAAALWLAASAVNASAEAPLRQSPAETLSVADLAEVADLTAMTISPDGRKVALRVSRPDVSLNLIRTEWLVLNLDSGEIVGAFDGGEPTWRYAYILEVQSPVWSTDSASLFVRRLDAGEVQVWRLDLQSRTQRQVTAGPADVTRFALLGEDRLVYETTAERQAVVELEERQRREGVVIDPSVESTYPLFGSLRYNGRMMARRRVRGDVQPLLSDIRSTWTASIRDAAASRRAATPEELVSLGRPEARPGRARTVELTHPSGKMAKVSLEANERRDGKLLGRLAWRPSSDAAWRLCEDALCGGSVEGFSWSSGGRHIYFTVVEGLNTELRRFDTSTSKVARVARDGLIYGWSRMNPDGCPAAGDRLLCVTASASTPPRLEMIDGLTGNRRTLFAPGKALEAKLSGHARVTQISWRDKEGRLSNGVLLRPLVSSEPSPLVIVTYSCRGFLKGGTGEEYPEHLLVREGFAVLCADFDNSWWSEAPPPGMPNVYSPLNAGLRSLEAAVDLLVDQKVADPRRIGVGGLSWGAMTVQYALFKSNLFAAAVVSGPAGVDPHYYSGSAGPNSARARQITQSWGLPSPDFGEYEMWKTISPALNADKITAPLLIQASEVEFPGERQLFNNLLDLGKPVEAVVFAGGEHQKVEPAQRAAIYERNLDWFAFWLQGRERAGLGKEAQFARWRELRTGSRSSATLATP